MPMFLHRSNGTVLGTTSFLFLGLSKSQLEAVFLPTVMRKSFIGLGHTVNVFLLLDGCAFAVRGIQ